MYLQTGTVLDLFEHISLQQSIETFCELIASARKAVLLSHPLVLRDVCLVHDELKTRSQK
jgi:hypothetical protein